MFPPLPPAASPTKSQSGSHPLLTSPWASVPVKDNSATITTALAEPMDTLSSMVGSASSAKATSSQLDPPVSAEVTMQESSESSAPPLSCPEDFTTLTGLVPCTETSSITSNAVIEGLNAHSNHTNATPPIPTTTTTANDTTNSFSPATVHASQENVKNWAQKLESSTDKSLKRVSSPSFSPEGIPRVKIPDSVFQKGAQLHQDFVLGIFMGKTPSGAEV